MNEFNRPMEPRDSAKMSKPNVVLDSLPQDLDKNVAEFADMLTAYSGEVVNQAIVRLITEINIYRKNRMEEDRKRADLVEQDYYQLMQKIQSL